MVKATRTLTAFGKDIDSLLKRAGNINIREYADQAGVSYNYVLQLRTIENRHPGRLYVNLLKPFANLKLLGLSESHQLSVRHRGRPLSLAECCELFSDLPEKEILDSINRTLRSEEGTVPAPPMEITSTRISLNQLYRRVFVGRERELQELRATFDAISSGPGALVMVAGESGIGKTALCEQLFAYVTHRGGQTLVGHCYSEGSLSLPYLAFMEALRSYALSIDTDKLRKELADGAADIARILPEITTRLKVLPRSWGSPEEERYRLLQEVSEFLGNAAKAHPLLVILEDLHNADKGTLEMLTHLSHNLKDYRLMVVGTYRDVEVDRKHPLSAALAELRRIPNFNRVLLRGLNADEVSRMLSNITGHDMPWGLAEAVFRQTEGNPLFIQEVARYLVEEGLITREGKLKKVSSEMPVEIHIPDGLRDVIGKRLSSLSEPCNGLLAVAAVVGREFRVDILQKVAGIPDEELINGLEEAKKVAVLEERTGVGVVANYRFAHAFFRQTLYEEIIAPRRIQLHRQVAGALEEIHAGRLEEHAAELAEHFSHSSDSNDLAKAVRYGEMAAKRATDVYAYGEAVRLFEQAIKVQEVLDPQALKKKCDLLLDLCNALLEVPDTRRILEAEAPAAFSLAESIGDGSRAVRACKMALDSIFREQAGPGYMNPQYDEWAGRLDRYARPDTAERACADYHLGCVKYYTRHMRSGLRLLGQALDLARRLGDREILTLAGSALLLYRSAPQHTEERRRLVEELWANSRAGSSYETASAWSFMGDTFLALGQRQRAEEVFDKIRNLATRTGNINLGLISAAMDSILALMDGRFEDVMDITERIRIRGEEAGISERANILATTALKRAQFYLGAPFEAFSPNQRLLLYLRPEEDISSILEQRVVRRPTIGTLEDETIAMVDIQYLELAVLTGHRKAAELLLNRFSGTGLCASGQWEHPTCVPRHLGGACALLSRYEEARKYYAEAIKVCTEMPFRPELALSRLQLAELLLEHYPKEKKEAVEHLDFCIKEFKEMKMQPSLEKALRHKEILKA